MTGCGVRGPVFSPTTMVPPGKGLVYIYRPKNFVGSGVAYFVVADGARIVKLKNGGYFPYVVDPGTRVFSAKTEAMTQAAIEVQPDGVYYLKGTVTVGAFVGRPALQEVHPVIAVNEIARCRLLR